MTKNLLFFDGCFDKNRIKSLISWSLVHCGGNITIELVENLKNLGYTYATEAGISLGIDDLKIPPTKKNIITQAEKEIHNTQINYKHEYLTGIEKFQQLIDTWHRTSERLKHNVIQYFKATDILNPVYMMAFSGARGNISQVRQLVGMRGLMSDPQGQILDFPIKSNFREGLTLTEYIISCYGARKGLVDTALKTANSGYLTRRLVDVSHHIIVCEFDCKTTRGIIIKDIIENKKVTLSLQSRLIGRILAKDIHYTQNTDSSSTKLNTRSLFNKQNKKRNTLTLKKITVPAGSEISFSIEKSLRLEKKTLAKTFRRKPSSFKVVSLLSALFFETNAQLNLLKVQRNRIRLYALFIEKTNIDSFYATDFPHLFFLNSEYESRMYRKNADFFNQVDMTISETSSLPDVSYTNFNLQEFLLRVHYTQFLKVQVVARKNDEISPQLAAKIATLQKKVLVRSPLTCEIKNSICQLCYGWSLAYGKLVSLGEAVGVIAAQSIGEPGTQLTMRTFHTGGVFSGDVMSEITSPCNGIVSYPNSFPGMLIRTPHGKIAFLTKVRGKFNIYPTQNKYAILPSQDSENLDLNIKSKFNNEVQDSIKQGFTSETFKSGLSESKFKVSPRENFKFLNQGLKDSQGESLILENALEFQIPALTILFSRNHEYVHKTQIIAEFSAVSQNRNQRIKSKYDLKSEIEGEIIFQEGASYIERIKRDKEEPKKDKYISCTTLNIGSVWILSTKMYKQRIPTDIIPQPGDIVDQYSIFGQYEIMSLYNGFMTGSTKKSKMSSNIKNTVFLQQNYESSFNKNQRQKNHNLSFNLKKPKLSSNFTLKAANSLYYKKAKNISDLNNSFSAKVFLNQTHISLPVHHIQYKKIGYFFSFFTSNRSKLYFDRFFVSNSLQQQFHNSTTLKTHFYFQSFPKISQTQTGGSLIFDPFYVHEKKYCGEIFCIPEEIYIFNSINSIFFSLNLDSHHKFAKRNNYSMKWNHESLILKNNVKKKYCKWNTKKTSLIFYKNLQGKIVPFYSTLSGHTEIDSRYESKKAYKVKYIDNRGTALNIYPFQKNQAKSKNTKKDFFKTPILNLVPNQAYADSKFSKRKQKIQNLKNVKISNNKTLIKNNIQVLNPYYYTSQSTILGFQKNPKFVFSHFKQNKKIKLRIIPNNYLSFLRSQFPFKKNNYSFSKYTNETWTSRTFGSKVTPRVKASHEGKKIASLQVLLDQQNKFESKVTNGNFKSKFSKPELLPFLKKKVKLKSGWIYFPINFSQIICKHKSIIKPSAECFDNIVFDQYPVFLECVPIEKLSVQNKKNIFQKTHILKQMLSIQDIYLKFKINALDLTGKNEPERINSFSSYKTSKDWKNADLKSKRVYLEKFFSSANSYVSLDKIFFHMCTTLFFDNVFSIFQIIYNKKERNISSGSFYSGLSLEKYVQSSLNPNLIGEQVNLNNTFLHTVQKLYEYEKIYFIHNPNDKCNLQFGTFKFLNRYFLFLASQFKNFSINTSNKSISFHRNKLFFSKFFVLFRKMISYSIPNSLRYKKLLTQEKQFTFYSFLNSQKSNDKVTHFTKLMSFNKQNKTYIFNPIPTTDFIVQSYCKDKKCKIHYFFKKKIIVELYVQVLVSRNYLLNHSKIALTSNSSTSLFSQKKNTNSKNFNMVINYYNLLYSNANICFNMIFFEKIRFPYLACSRLPNTKSFVNQDFLKQSSKKKKITSIQTEVLLSLHNSISNQEPVSVINFFSTYQGEILELYKKNFDNVSASKLHDQNLVEAFFGSEGKKKHTYLILTDEDKVNFFTGSPISKSEDKTFKSSKLGQVLLNQQNQSGSTTYSENRHDNQSNVPLKIILGQYIEYGTKIQNNLALSESGQIIQIEKSKLTLRKAQSILFSPNGFLSVQDRDIIEKNALVLSLFYQRLKTGDIVQGIPRIEQLFEARQTHQGEILAESLHTQLEWLFYRYQLKHTPQQAARRSIEKIQQVIVQNVQNVYQSQGVRIAEKHLEIIVRQMTSKVQIIHGGETFLIAGELVDLDWIEKANQGIKENETKATYKPVIRGITQKSLDTKSFISEASFQETTRILTKSAIQRKIDFLRGLKENVILGHVIPAGTGFKEKIIDSNKRKYISHSSSQLDYKNYKLYTNFTNIFFKNNSRLKYYRHVNKSIVLYVNNTL